jgi:tetratricopeptide (TPR) repeat protein
VTQSLEKEIGSLRSLFWSERDPEGRAFAPLADAYGRAGDFQQAMQLLTEGIGRHPGFSTGHVVAARLYLEKGLVAEAEMAVDSALGLDGDNVVALASLAEVREAQGELEEAEWVRAKIRSLELATEEVAEEVAEEAPGEATEEVVDAGVVPVDVFLDITDLAPNDAAIAELISDPVDSATEPLEILPAELEPPLEEESAGSWLDAAFPDLVEPVEPVEDVADVLDLAPEGPVVDVLDLLGAEPVAGVVDLAPDGPATDAEVFEADEPVVDVLALAPDEPETEVLDVAPDEPVVDIFALAPDEPEVDIFDLAPDEPVLDVLDLRPDGRGEEQAVRKPDSPAVEDSLPMDEMVDTEPVLTRTMAELYLEQGLADRALRVYRGLLADDPEDDELQARIAELECRPEVTVRVEPEGADEEAELADPAWDAEAQAAPHDVDTPFAWTDDEGEQAFTGPAIGTFFDQLLAWQPDHSRADDDGPGREEEEGDS